MILFQGIRILSIPLQHDIIATCLRCCKLTMIGRSQAVRQRTTCVILCVENIPNSLGCLQSQRATITTTWYSVIDNNPPHRSHPFMRVYDPLFLLCFSGQYQLLWYPPKATQEALRHPPPPFPTATLTAKSQTS